MEKFKAAAIALRNDSNALRAVPKLIRGFILSKLALAGYDKFISD